MYLSIYVSTSVQLYIYVCISIYLYIYIAIYIYLPIYLCIYILLCPPETLSHRRHIPKLQGGSQHSRYVLPSSALRKV